MMVCSSPHMAALGLILLALRPDAVSARLLSGGRSEPPQRSLSTEKDLPAFQLLRSKQVRAHSGAWALKGVPTHYEPSGCKNVKKVYSEVKNTQGFTSMSVERCFGFCSKRKGMVYFGVHHADECWCGEAFDGSPMEDRACDEVCPGAPDEKCGGIEGTNVYVMIDCVDATQAEIDAEKEEKKQALLNSYGSWTEESCGQDSDNVLQLDGAGHKTGTVDDCKLACWEGHGAEECHGFSYDSTTSKCTFHFDVTAGKVEKGKSFACYWKMP